MRISQSFLKSYATDKCKWRVKLKYVDGIRLGFDPDNIRAVDKGHLFEFLLLGKGTGDADIFTKWPKSSKGKPYADEIKITSLATDAKEILQKRNVTWSDKDVDVEIEYRDLRGRVDFIGKVDKELALCDLKYTETKEDDRWSPFAWGDIDKIDYTQPLHYVTIYFLKYNVHLPWYFMVFSPYGKGWVKFIRVDVSKEQMNTHIARIKDVKEQLKDEQWTPTYDYNECRGCELAHLCDKKKQYPDDIRVEL